MQPALKPHHRFTGSYKPPERVLTTLGICPCGCGEAITDNYVYVECQGEYFIDRDHFMKHMGAVEIG